MSTKIEARTSKLAQIKRSILIKIREGTLPPHERHRFAFPLVKKVVLNSLDATEHERALVGGMLGVGLGEDNYSHHADLIKGAGLDRAIDLIKQAQMAAATYSRRLSRIRGVRSELADRHAAQSVENAPKYLNTVNELLRLLKASAIAWHYALSRIHPTQKSLPSHKYAAVQYVLQSLATEHLK